MEASLRFSLLVSNKTRSENPLFVKLCLSVLKVQKVSQILHENTNYGGFFLSSAEYLSPLCKSVPALMTG